MSSPRASAIFSWSPRTWRSQYLVVISGVPRKATQYERQPQATGSQKQTWRFYSYLMTYYMSSVLLGETFLACSLFLLLSRPRERPVSWVVRPRVCIHPTSHLTLPVLGCYNQYHLFGV